MNEISPMEHVLVPLCSPPAEVKGAERVKALIASLPSELTAAQRSSIERFVNAGALYTSSSRVTACSGTELVTAITYEKPSSAKKVPVDKKLSAAILTAAKELGSTAMSVVLPSKLSHSECRNIIIRVIEGMYKDTRFRRSNGKNEPDTASTTTTTTTTTPVDPAVSARAEVNDLPYESSSSSSPSSTNGDAVDVRLERINFVHKDFTEEDKRAVLDACRGVDVMAEAVYFAKDLVNAPPNVKTPTAIANLAETIARQGSLQCTILGEVRAPSSS